MIHNYFREEFFDRNIALFNQKNPVAAIRLDLILDHFELEPCLTEKLEPNLKQQRYGLTDYYHAPSGALEEMSKAIPEKFINQAEIIYFYGIGLGYAYEVLKEWLKSNPTHHIVFLEDNLEVLYFFFHTELGTEVLEDSQVTLIYFQDYQLEVERFFQLHSNFLAQHIDFLVLPYYALRKEKEALNLCYLILHNTALSQEVHREYQTGSFAFLYNFYPNLLKIHESYAGHHLFNKFKNVPAIICGAGPSLKKNIQLLKTLSQNALIFAGGSSLNVLNEENMMPHFGLGIDPNTEQLHRLLTNHAFHLPYLYRQRVNHLAMDVIGGPKIYISGSYNELAHWFEKELDIDIPKMDEGHNVINFCTNIAYLMGCNPIIYVGLDLAYSNPEENTETYAKGINTHPLWIANSHPYQINPEERLVNRPNIYGKPVQTRWDWISESMWIANTAHKYSNTSFINATEGGIGFANVINLTLAEVKNLYLKEEYDLDGWVHLAIQSAEKVATKEKIIKNMQQMQASLQHSLLICTEILNEKNEQIKQHSNEPLNFYTHQTTLAEHHLENEIAYQHFLKEFNQNYNYLNKAKDSLSHSSSDVFKKEVERIAFLQKTLFQHLQLLVKAVQYTLQNSPSSEQKALLTQFEIKNSSYSFKNHHLIIEEPALHLKINEKIDPDLPQEKLTIYYSESEQIKQDAFYLEGHLHGPSYFYSSQGVLLSETWFKQGKKQGYCYRYYLSGALYSILGYRDNQLEGEQNYFYEDGTPYVKINYKEGLLDGPVTIYYSNGSLKRELHYQKGKRQGWERAWNAQEKLMIECEYHQGIPVNTAKEWNAEETLIKKVDIHDYPEDFDLSIWDNQGEKIKYYRHGIEDLTDMYQKSQAQVKILEESLQNLVDKMNNLIQERKNQLKESQPDLDEQLEKLGQAFIEMNRLKEKMLEQMNLEIQANEKEREKIALKSKQKQEKFNPI